MFFNMYLSRYEKIQIMTSTFLFLILILLFRPMIIGLVPKNLNIIVMTLLFFVWFSLSQTITMKAIENPIKKIGEDTNLKF